MKKDIQALTKDILTKLEITPKKITVTKDDQDTYQVDLDLTENDKGILIGYHGDTVSAFQLIIGLMLYKKAGTWTRVIVNIGDYRQKREESLEKMAQDTAQRVKTNGEPIALFNLNPFERRIVHAFLSEDPDVTTISEGEARNRHLIVSPSEQALKSAPPPPEEEPPLEEPTNE